MAKFKVKFTQNDEQHITKGSFYTKQGAQNMADSINNSNNVYSPIHPIYGINAHIVTFDF